MLLCLRLPATATVAAACAFATAAAPLLRLLLLLLLLRRLPSPNASACDGDEGRGAGSCAGGASRPERPHMIKKLTGSVAGHLQRACRRQREQERKLLPTETHFAGSAGRSIERIKALSSLKIYISINQSVIILAVLPIFPKLMENALCTHPIAAK